MAAAEQQAAVTVQQPAASQQQLNGKTQPSQFPYRVTGNYAAYQTKNIEVLRQKMGGADNLVLRTAIDVLAYLNGLPTQTDPSIWLGNFLNNVYPHMRHNVPE
jgi:hypothetical protein